MKPMDIINLEKQEFSRKLTELMDKFRDSTGLFVIDIEIFINSSSALGKSTIRSDEWKIDKAVIINIKVSD